MAVEWSNRSGKNYTIQTDIFAISFNPKAKGNKSIPRGPNSKYKEGEPAPETALVLFEGEEGSIMERKYFLLEGDFRKEYEVLFEKGFDECMKFYNEAKKSHGIHLT